jgi:hypothetical protein
VRGDDAVGDGADAGKGERRAAERSAQRAAAVAATEGFHPLRVRPYVAEPDGEPAETTVRPLVSARPGGTATEDLGLFPAMYSGLEYAEDEPDAGHAQARAAAAAIRGRHRRRRRGVVIMAAAVAASALAAGAVAVTGQVMGDEQGRTDRALPDQNSSVPDVTLPSDAGLASATAAPPVIRKAAPGSTAPTATPSQSPSASPAAPATTPAAPTDSASPSDSPSAATATTATTTPPASSPSVHSRAPAPDAVLEIGDTGSAVADLQRRLTEVRVYHGPIDGVFGHRLQQAVATFQVWYWVSDAPDGSHNGVYGPDTRKVLERQT